MLHPARMRPNALDRLGPVCPPAAQCLRLVRGERKAPEPGRLPFGQAYQHLRLVVVDDVYRQFAYVDHAIRILAPDPP